VNALSTSGAGPLSCEIKGQSTLDPNPMCMARVCSCGVVERANHTLVWVEA